MAGYHTTEIPKGELGELSKIQEELAEALDAAKQGSKLMTVLELSDMIGATAAYLEKHCPGFDVADLLIMAMITRRAFESGERK